MQSIAKFSDKKIECIPKTEEKYTTFSIGKLQFLDSMAFMNSSLSKLVDALAEINIKEGKTEPNVTNFPIMMRHFKDRPLKDIQLLVRKGVYPYDYMNSKDRFNETHLPPKEAFYSTLSGQHISDDDYMHAIRVWKVFNIKNMGEYNDLYLLTDVLLLADVFESFRNMCLKYYSLDPCHYITLPSFAWDASLRIHNQVLELFTGEQSDMYLKVEDSIRGGISMITHKYAKANNKYMSSYDKNKSPLYIIYLDANNLYGWAMSQYLPYGNYQDDTDVDKYTPEYIMSLEDNTHEGCFLVVDLEYPKELHDLHNDYPLAPQRKRVTKDMLSNHTKEIMNKSYLFLNPSKKDSEKNKDRSKGDAVDKLICDFSDKINYGVHYRALKFYLSQGLKLKKVHSVITFSQSAWLKEYIDFNTAKRAVAKNEFGKDYF